MQIFNISIPELLFVLVIMLIFLGPDNMVKSARQIGRFISRMTKSPMWATMISTSREIRELPTRIVREAGLEESMKEINRESGEVSKQLQGELSPAVEHINAAGQQLRSTTDELARASQPVAFRMRRDRDDEEPKEAEEVSAPLETDSAEEIEEMVEDAVEGAVPEPGERSIVPPAIIETGEDVSITDDFARPAVEDTENEPAAEAEEEGRADEDGRDFGIPPAIIEPDSESFEDAIIGPLVDISHPEPLQDNLIKGRPMTRIPERRPGAPLPEDTPPPPVDLPGEDEPDEDEAGERQD